MKIQNIIPILLLVGLCSLNAQTINSPTEQQPSKPEEKAARTGGLAALQLEMTNAYQRVLQIVNRPVKAFAQVPNLPVATFSPGWFHEGAIKPDFNAVDVRQSQELIYAKHKYVTSDLNPGIVFLGQDLEFNAMTKMFYTNRSLPKCRLTEAEMGEINQLYRTIGRCEGEINRLQAPPAAETVHLKKGETDVDPVVPGQALQNIRGIPQQTRVLYGGIGIGVIVLGVIVARIVKTRS